MDEIQLEKNTAFYATFEFKGRELEPFSEGRRSVAASIGVRFNGPPDDSDDNLLRDADGEVILGKDGKPKRKKAFETCITDIHAVIFICLSDRKTLAKAHRDPDGFWEKVLEWADENITPADYKEESELAARIVNSAFATQVEEVPPEPGSAPAKPSGN